MGDSSVLIEARVKEKRIREMGKKMRKQGYVRGSALREFERRRYDEKELTEFRKLVVNQVDYLEQLVKNDH